MFHFNFFYRNTLYYIVACETILPMNIYFEKPNPISLNQSSLLHPFLKPFFLTLFIFISIMMANTYYIYLELIIKSKIDSITILKLLIFSLPAILVVAMPVASFFGFSFAIRESLNTQKDSMQKNQNKSTKYLLKNYLILACILSSITLGLNELIVPRTNQSTVAIATYMLMNKEKGIEAYMVHQPSVRELRSSQALELILKKQRQNRETQRDWIDYHLKDALPLTILFLFPLAMGLGLLLANVFSLLGFMHGIMTIMLWYIIYSVSANLGYAGIISPFIAAWLPNIVMGLAGSLFLILAINSSVLGIPINFTGDKHDHCQYKKETNTAHE